MRDVTLFKVMQKSAMAPSWCVAACVGGLRQVRGPGALRALRVEAERGAGGGGQFAFTCGVTPTQVFAIGMKYASHAKAHDSQKLPTVP